MKNRTLIALLMVVLLLLSWYMGLNNAFQSNSDYRAYIKQAETYAQEQLYQKAIDAYNTALTYEDTLDVRLQVVDLYKKGMEIGEITTNGNLVSTLLETMSTYREAPAAYEAACDYFYSILAYEELTNALQQATQFGVESERVEQIRSEVRYLYELTTGSYAAPVGPTYGKYIIQNQENYYSVNLYFNTVQSYGDFIAPYSAGGYTLVQFDDRVFIVDGSGVRQQYFDNTITASSGLADGYLACKSGETYAYYNTAAEKVSEDYAYAGRFSSGVAAVKLQDNTWRLINNQFEVLTNTAYEDIKLNSAEECVAGGIILAKKDGKYSMLAVSDYDAENPSAVKVENKGSFTCDDAELPVDPTIGGNAGAVLFAFSNGGSWGFADCEGAVVIEPKFAKARSFSNNFAAVSENGDTWSFINTAGEVVIQGDFADAWYFNSNGLCFVKTDAEASYWSYIQMYYWES